MGIDAGRPDSTTEISKGLRVEADRAGFDLCGICAAVAPPGMDRFREWIDAGYAGEMRYLVDRAEAYADPRHVLDGVRSLVVLGQNYRTVERAANGVGQDGSGYGEVSRYAWGNDYHDTIRARLNDMAAWLRGAAPGCRVRGVVDTAPLAEREFAVLAGLGWVGKNTLVLNPKWGSWFFLAVLLTDVELEYDAPFEADHCGTCRACLDACPTDAFVAPYVLDARRCISYVTIEQRSAVEGELRGRMGSHVFGCDVCQDVCPWNRETPTTDREEFLPKAGTDPMELAALFDLDEAKFRERFRRTPLWRAKRRGLLRNAALVLGGQGEEQAIDALVQGVNDEESLVRSASAWALGQIGGKRADRALATRGRIESDEAVRAEIQAAIAGMSRRE